MSSVLRISSAARRSKVSKVAHMTSGPLNARCNQVESADATRAEHHVVFLQNFFDELRRKVPLGK